MRQSLEKIKAKIKKSSSIRKEDFLKKYKLSSKSVTSKVEFLGEERGTTSDKESDDENIFNEDNGIVHIDKVFLKKIKIEYIDKKALRYLSPIFISSIFLGILIGIIFYF